MKVDIDADDVQKKTTDDRGRFYLGSGLANTEVEIAVLDVAGDTPDEYKVSCPECGGIVEVDGKERASELRKDHDERNHDGELTAKILDVEDKE